MEYPDILSSIVGAAVTLSGFSAAFKAFSGGHDVDGISRSRLNIVIEGGLVVTWVCFFPFVLTSLNTSDDLAWRCGSALMIAWLAVRGLWPGTAIAFSPRPWPALYPFPLLFGWLAFFAGALNVTTLSELPAYNLFLAGTVLLFANIAMVFVAQFHAEQQEG